MERRRNVLLARHKRLRFQALSGSRGLLVSTRTTRTTATTLFPGALPATLFRATSITSSEVQIAVAGSTNKSPVAEPIRNLICPPEPTGIAFGLVALGAPVGVTPALSPLLSSKT